MEIWSSDNILPQFSQEKCSILANARIYGDFVTKRGQEQRNASHAFVLRDL